MRAKSFEKPQSKKQSNAPTNAASTRSQNGVKSGHMQWTLSLTGNAGILRVGAARRGMCLTLPSPSEHPDKYHPQIPSTTTPWTESRGTNSFGLRRGGPCCAGKAPNIGRKKQTGEDFDLFLGRKYKNSCVQGVYLNDSLL